MKNTISTEQCERLKSNCTQYSEANSLFDIPFWGIIPCTADGDATEDWSDAASILFQVYNFDSNHGHDWIKRMLLESGVLVDESTLGRDYTDIISGSGELTINGGIYTCPICGYMLRYSHEEPESEGGDPLSEVFILGFLDARAKKLREKIARYEGYIDEDEKLVAKNPDKYRNRLKNHTDKLNRQKAHLAEIEETLANVGRKSIFEP